MQHEVSMHDIWQCMFYNDTHNGNEEPTRNLGKTWEVCMTVKDAQEASHKNLTAQCEDSVQIFCSLIDDWTDLVRPLRDTVVGGLRHKAKGALAANHEALDDLNGVIQREVH